MKNLFSLVKGIRGCQFANLIYIAEGGIPQYVLGKGKVVTKLVRTDVQINFEYENAVNNRLEKQGDERIFEAESLPWGEWEIVNKVITHKGNRYLRYYVPANADIKSVWFVDGKVATAEEFGKIIAYLQSKNKTSKRQADAGLVENQVVAKAIKFSNILRLAVDGTEWERECEWETTALAEVAR
jgi:hypothetical protein